MAEKSALFLQVDAPGFSYTRQCHSISLPLKVLQNAEKKMGHQQLCQLPNLFITLTSA